MGELCIQGFWLNVDGRWPIAEPTSHTLYYHARHTCSSNDEYVPYYTLV